MNKSRKLTIVSKVFLVLGLSIASALWETGKEARASEEPSLVFSATSKILRVGESFSVDVMVDTGGQSVHGTGAKISFDPEVLEVLAIQPGTIFGDYPVVSHDDNTGKIIVSGISSSIQDEFSGRGVFATLTFRGIKKGGTSVQFTFEPGSTIDSNIAVTYGTGDILSRVDSLLVTVTSGAGGLISVPTTVISKPVSGEDRSLSGSIDAHGPIPSRPPITDANQEQPVSIIASVEGKANVQTIKILLAIVVVVILALLGKRFFGKSRRKPTMIVQKL